MVITMNPQPVRGRYTFRTRSEIGNLICGIRLNMGSMTFPFDKEYYTIMQKESILNFGRKWLFVGHSAARTSRPELQFHFRFRARLRRCDDAFPCRGLPCLRLIRFHNRDRPLSNRICASIRPRTQIFRTCPKRRKRTYTPIGTERCNHRDQY